MKISYTLSLVAPLLAVSTLSASTERYDQTVVKSKALEVLAKALVDYKGNGEVSESSRNYSYRERNVRVSLDKKDLSLVQVTNDAIERHIFSNETFDPSSPSLPQEQLIALAKQYASRVTDISNLSQATMPDPPVIGDTLRTSRRVAQVYLSTEQEIRSEAIGNYVTVVMDCQTGNLWHVRISSGYEYESLDKLIPEPQAIAAAQTRVDTQLAPALVRLEYRAYREGEDEQKICRPVYCIFIDKHLVYVNAKTGDVSDVGPWGSRQ